MSNWAGSGGNWNSGGGGGGWDSGGWNEDSYSRQGKGGGGGGKSGGKRDRGGGGGGGGGGDGGKDRDGGKSGGKNRDRGGKDRDGGRDRGGGGKDREFGGGRDWESGGGRSGDNGKGGGSGGKNSGGGGGQKGGGGGSGAPKGPGEPLKPGESLRLNPNDCESGLTLLGAVGSGTRERGKRSGAGGSPWAGVRGDCGVAAEGRWAFCVWNETGGNLRIGWSAAEATLELGKDRLSWGYGGTATKSHANNFEKFGQTFGKDDAITCCLDLERRAILYFKNGREIPGDCFTFGKEMSGVPLFPHIYTKEATFSVSFDGSGGAPPLSGGFQWIAAAGNSLLPHHTRVSGGPGPVQAQADAANDGGSEFVLTPYGWRTKEQAGGITQEWRSSLDAYVRHFTSSLELEYEAERGAVIEKVHKRTTRQLQDEGIGVAGLSAEFDAPSGRITLWPDGWRLPYLSEIKWGRAVLLSTVDGGLDLEDAKKTISAEVESIQGGTMVLSTPFERLPSTGKGSDLFRIDLGPNIVANKRIDRMLDELQRCLGTNQVSGDKIQKLNFNANLCGLLLPGAPLADALYADIQESSAAAMKWDPLERAKPNPKADISRASKEADIGADPYNARSEIHSAKTLNQSQQGAVKQVLEERRRFNLIQGPPGTGKTTTASAIICGWLKSNRGPILASAFSNRGCDNIAGQLHSLGVRVLRMGLCSAKEPYSLETRLQECGMKRGDKGLKKVLESVDVVAATCIGCGMGPLDSLTFPFIVIDEAAQVIEPAVILPLGKGAVQAVMVGDQCQLPATVLSQEAQGQGLDVSMFDRLLSMGMDYTLLTDQYRMHPSISAFPSWRFYRGELKNAVTDSDRQLPPGMPFRSNLVFLHVDAMEASGGASKKNFEEADCATWIAGLAMKSGIAGGDIGIISPYGAQVTLIRNSLGQTAQNLIQVSTVDAFQGSEREVIIFTLVRANKRGDVGFVADWRRLNVALTRAKRLCVVIGHIPTWLNANSGLIRDWAGFHRIGRADVRAFRGGNLTSLPEDVSRQVAQLRDEFQKNNPPPAKLLRSEKASRNVSAAGKKMREMTQALEDAMKGDDEVVLKTLIQQAKEANVEKATIDEAENVLEGFSASKKLAAAVSSKDPTALVQAIIQAKMSGISADDIKKAEALMSELVVPTDGQGKAFYAPKAAENKEADGAAAPKKSTKAKSWASLTNTTGPKYAGRNREEAPVQEDLPPPQSSVGGKGKGGGKPSAGEKAATKPSGPHLRVHPEHGAGLDLTPTCWGMRVDAIEPEPGQEHLKEGSTIISIDGVTLLGLPDEDSVCDAFAEKFADGVRIEVDPVSFETIPLPVEATTFPASFCEDLKLCSDKFAMEHNITRMGLEIWGPSVALEPAKAEVKQLLDFYLQGQSAEQQSQQRINQDLLLLAQQRFAERQKREYEEYMAWQNQVAMWQEQQLAYMRQQAEWQASLQMAAQQMMGGGQQYAAQPQITSQANFASHQTYAAQQQQQLQQQQALQQQQYAAQQQAMQQHAAIQQQQQQYAAQQMYGQQARAQSEWVTCYSPQGQPYYYNERTGETAWTLPPGVQPRDGGMACGGGMGAGAAYGGGAAYGQNQGWQTGGYPNQSWY